MSETSEDLAPKRPRRKRKNYSLLILAAGLLLFGVAASTPYYFLRPVTLTIAVAPPGSDDQKLIQALAQTFARDQSPVRLSTVVTENAAESIAALTRSKVDMAVARADLNLPANADAVAILRKNVVVLWAPSGLRAKGSRRPPTPKIKSLDDLDGHRIGVIGQTDANVTLLRVILKQFRRQSRQGRGDAIRRQPDRRNGARYDARCLHGGRPARQQDHRGRDRRDGRRTGRAEIPADRRFRGNRREASAL